MVPGLGEGFDPGGVLIAVGRQLCYAMVIFVPVAITTQLLGRRLPAVRQALWLLVVVRLVLPPDLASVHSVRAWWFPEAPPAVGVAFVGHGSAMVPGHSGVPASLTTLSVMAPSERRGTNSLPRLGATRLNTLTKSNNAEPMTNVLWCMVNRSTGA